MRTEAIKKGQRQASDKQRMRRKKLIDCGLMCFGEKGIEKTALSDIASCAQIGEATLYRYFSNKENLALECGIAFWELAASYYEAVVCRKDYQGKSGIQQIEELLLATERIYEEHREKMKFLHDLDVFMVSHKMDEEKQKEYEKTVESFMPLLCNAIEKGKQDGSVSIKADTREIYYTLTHTILSLLQKMAGMGHILSGDDQVEEKRRIELLRLLLLEGLKHEKQDS